MSQMPHGSVNRWEIAALGLWALVAAWLYFRPHEFILGGADAGVYVNLGANIARTGGILIHDPTLAALDPSLYPSLLRPLPPGELTPYYLMPAFYVPATPAGLIIPQFYPLHPVWQAVAYALGGLRAELLITPLWGFLGALAVYFTTRRLWGWRAGMLALAALSVTALQVWFARYPTTEMLTQYLLWTGIWALIAWMDKQEPRGLWAALAGAALGQVFLTRIDAYFLLVLPVLLAIWLWWTHDWRRQDAWFFAPFLLLAAHSLIHGVLLSSPYFFSLFRYSRGLISRSLVIPLALVGLAALALIVLSLRPQLRARAFAWVAARRSLWITGAVALVLGLAVFGYFVRPHLGEVKTCGLLVRRRRNSQPGSREPGPVGLVSRPGRHRAGCRRDVLDARQGSESAHGVLVGRRALLFAALSVAHPGESASDLRHAPLRAGGAAFLHYHGRVSD